jgi:fumarate hydratase class II
VFRALGLVVAAAANVNGDLGVLPRETAEKIASAANTMAEDARDGAVAIPAVDARALERAWAMSVEGVAYRSGADLGEVAAGHAAGATVASAVLLAAVLGLQKDLLAALYRVESAVQGKAVRTQDRVDRAAAGLCERARKRLTVVCEELRALPLADRLPDEPAPHPEWAPRVTAYLNKRFRLQLRAVEGRWASLDAVSEAAGAVRQACDAFLRAAVVLDRGAQSVRLAVAEARGADLTITTLAGVGDAVHGYGRWPLAAASLIGAGAAALAAAAAIVSDS